MLFLEKGSVSIQNCSNIIMNPNRVTSMNRETGQTQRKVRFPNILRRKAAKKEPAKVVDETEYPSCQTQRLRMRKVTFTILSRVVQHLRRV